VADEKLFAAIALNPLNLLHHHWWKNPFIGFVGYFLSVFGLKNRRRFGFKKPQFRFCFRLTDPSVKQHRGQ